MTTVLYDSEINTVEQLMQSDIKILATKGQMEFQMENGKHFPQKMIDFFVIAESEEDVIYHRDQMDTRYGYLVPSDRWGYYAKQQELLRKPLFKYSEICTGQYFVTYPMKFDNHLEEPLKYCIMLCQQYGLVNAWTDRSFRDAIEMDIFEILIDGNPDNVQALDLSFFSIGWALLLTGQILGGLVFILEVVVKHN